jgi:D-alanyl-lipoteichoic acid acyltransferase DltB (MBOAT superfamily)
MLFSSPDYPLFLIAVFFLYGLARWGGPKLAWARIAVMVLLGDVVFMLVAKDPDTLWDPIGGLLIRGLLRYSSDGAPPIQPWLIVQWTIGAGVLAAAIAIGRRWGTWIASEEGQQLIAVGVVVALVAIGLTVGIAAHQDTLDAVTVELVADGHLIILFVLGIGIGSAWSSGERPLGRVVMLFVASSLFYHAWAAAMPGAYRYLLFLLLGTIVLDYYLGLWIERTEDPVARKALVIVSLCSNLGILVFFKYADFFVQDVLQLEGVDRLNLILPAGISFHTFQSLSYTIDVYRKQIKATRSVVEFATFVLFFPQLVAGPIVRAHDLLPQLANPPALELHKATLGLFRIVVGLFKKIAIADALALWIVDRVFEAPERFSSVEVMCGVYAYALQIYLDFSAYSDIAIGSAQLLGFDIPENFRTPYRSANLQEFWRRWHISLSTWLRDYLYIALGGSRGAEWRTYLNLTLTMLLGGLWHGASWAFIVWGALHGFGLAVTRFFQRATSRSSPDTQAAIAWRMFAACGALAVFGVGLLAVAFGGTGTWTQLVVAWLFVTPLWAVLTAWLGRDPVIVEQPVKPTVVDDGMPYRVLFSFEPERAEPIRQAQLAAEILRITMCCVALGLLAALRHAESWTWIPLVLVMWALGVAADIAEAGLHDWEVRLATVARRAVAIVLVFHYVCLAWVFFRATSFDNALAVLRQIADGSTDRANLIPMVTCALVVGFTCHFFADGSFRWLRRRFVGLPAPLQGLVLACAGLVLRELAHHEIVPFIYFQF